MNELQRMNGGELTEAHSIRETIVNAWLADIDAKAATVRTYSRSIRQFLVYLSSVGTSRPDRQTLRNYRASLEAAGNKPATVRLYLQAVKSFFKWAAANGYYENVAEAVTMPAAPKQAGHDYLTTRQARHLLESVKPSGDTLADLRDYALIRLLMTCGLRTIEAQRADVDDIGTQWDNTVLFVQGKGREGKAEAVKLPPHVEEAIRAYLTARGAKSGEPLFTATGNRNAGGRMTTRSISRICKGALQSAGLDSHRLTAHSLRHTAGALAIKAGQSLDEVATMLRHSSTAVTKIYTHGIEREQCNAELAIEKALAI